MAIDKQEPMFLTLLKTLQNEPKETLAMFFADSEKDLMKAYQEGKEARKNRLTIDKNPYPAPSDNELEKYTKYLCWGEGFVDTFFSELS